MFLVWVLLSDPVDKERAEAGARAAAQRVDQLEALQRVVHL